MAALVSGRLAYRVAMYGSGLGLLALWGPEQFARYAAATGTVAWLFALTSSGPEKAALSLIPRPDGAVLEPLFRRLAAVPFLILTASYLAAWAAGIDGDQLRYLAAAAMTAGVGSSAVLVGLYRLRGRPHADTFAYLALAAAYALVLSLAATVSWTVDSVLTGLVGLVGLVNVVLLAGLARTSRPSSRAGWSRSLAALRAAATLGVGELLSAASGSVLYLALAVTAQADQISRFYLLLVVSGAFSVGWSYLLRLVQPRMVAWLQIQGPIAGWRLAGQIFTVVATVGGGGCVGLYVILATVGSGSAVAFAALGLELLLYASTTAALLVAENIDAHARRWSAGGALVQFLIVAAVGWWLVPSAGAAGALAALCLGEVSKALVLRRVAGRVSTRHAADGRDAEAKVEAA